MRILNLVRNEIGGKGRLSVSLWRSRTTGSLPERSFIDFKDPNGNVFLCSCSAYTTGITRVTNDRTESDEHLDQRGTKVSIVDGFRDISNERMYSIASLGKHAKYPSMKGSQETSVEDHEVTKSSTTFDVEEQGSIGQKGTKRRKSRSELKAEARLRAVESEQSGESFEEGIESLFTDIVNGLESMQDLNEVFIVKKDPENKHLSLDLGNSIGIYSLTVDNSTSPPTLSYMSPVSGGHKYKYEASTGRFLCTNPGDNHDLKGIFTRDLIRLAIGCPRF